jgi:alpha-1,6-mannosyltransferase
MYYSSRTLPNFIPFGLSTVAVGQLLQLSHSPQKSASTKTRIVPALVILTILGIVFRSELAIFLGTHTIYQFFLGQRGGLTISNIVFSGFVGVISGLLLTVPLDSYLWQQYPLWPELTSFLFNVYEGKSVDWGVSPWHYYLTNSLPRILFNPAVPVVCIPTALLNSALRPYSWDLFIPNIAYILIYSFQPHKELRFIVYAIPALNALAAQGATWIWNRRSKSVYYKVLSLLLVLSCFASLLGSFVFLSISTLNYPGAAALNTLHAIADGEKPNIRVHVDVLTAQTGATRFLQLPGTANRIKVTAWTYDKTDDKTGDGTLLLRPDFWTQFDYALAERPEKCIGAWDEIATIEGLAGIGVVRPGEVTYEEKVPHDDIETQSLSSISVRGLYWGQGPWAVISKRLWSAWKNFGSLMRSKVTRGWWVDVKMRPMIHILKRVSHEEFVEQVVRDA